MAFEINVKLQLSIKMSADYNLGYLYQVITTSIKISRPLLRDQNLNPGLL